MFLTSITKLHRARAQQIASGRGAFGRDTVAKLREENTRFAEENAALWRETQETLPLGDVKIEPSRIRPMARWRLSEGGLLLAAGPRVAKLVARGGFDPCIEHLLQIASVRPA